MTECNICLNNSYTMYEQELQLQLSQSQLAISRAYKINFAGLIVISATQHELIVNNQPTQPLCKVCAKQQKASQPKFIMKKERSAARVYSAVWD